MPDLYYDSFLTSNISTVNGTYTKLVKNGVDQEAVFRVSENIKSMNITTVTAPTNNLTPIYTKTGQETFKFTRTPIPVRLFLD